MVDGQDVRALFGTPEIDITFCVWHTGWNEALSPIRENYVVSTIGAAVPSVVPCKYGSADAVHLGQGCGVESIRHACLHPPAPLFSTVETDRTHVPSTGCRCGGNGGVK